MSKIKVGTCVLYNIHGDSRVGRVTRIEKTFGRREKYGVEVDSVSSDEYYVLDLDNGQFAYHTQVKYVVE